MINSPWMDDQLIINGKLIFPLMMINDHLMGIDN